MRMLLLSVLLLAPVTASAQGVADRAARAAALTQLRERIVARFGAAEIMDRQGERQVLRLGFRDRRYRGLGRGMDDSMDVVLRFVRAHATGAYRPDSVDIHFLTRDTVVANEHRTEWSSRTYPLTGKPKR